MLYQTMQSDTRWLVFVLNHCPSPSTWSNMHLMLYQTIWSDTHWLVFVLYYCPSPSTWSSTERMLKIPETNLKTFGECSFVYIAPTVWNSLLADLRASPSLPTFKVKLKTHFFRQAFWLICTCQLLPVSYSCVCACVCVCVSWGRGWGLGGMELSVGSNIMIHFLYIFCCFSYGTCTCILYIVSCHNYMYYVCET